MPMVGLAWGARRLSWQQAKSEYQAGQFPYPEPLLSAMADSRDDEVPTASVISSCLRQFQLKRRHEYYERPQDLLPAIFGTAFHALMERYTEHDAPEIIDCLPGSGVDMTRGGPRHKELQLRTTVDLGIAGYEAVVVEGRCDYLHEAVLVRDWKSKKFLSTSHTPPQENVRQVNIYNWLAAENEYTPAPTWELVYASQSWVANFSGPTRKLSTVREFVTERLHEWALYESQGELVPPLPELFQADEKGKLPFPCGYCPVRDHCLAAWREGQEAPF